LFENLQTLAFDKSFINLIRAQRIYFYCSRERGERVLEERLAADHAADTEAPALGHSTAED
jgi:hypothetical protein